MMANMIRVDALFISEFRKLKDIVVDFKHRITLITGQNGTAKSTLLGMLAQPFSFGNALKSDETDRSVYISNYHGIRLGAFHDIAGNYYTYTCDKIFRLSKEHDTPDKKYLYEIKLSGIDFGIETTSPLKSKKLLTVKQPRGGKLRFVTGPGSNESISHRTGEGNFPHPVIYLSLGRLLPLAEVKTCDIAKDNNSLTADETKWYENSYREIFSIVDESPRSAIMDTKEKKASIVPIANDYDGESCSAGQDNIGRLLTAVLSFRRLKIALGDKYRGGLLLIDEVDATLHPSSQVRLISLLNREAEKLMLQLVMTTHSMYLVKSCEQSSLKNDVGIVHIQKVGENIRVNSDATIRDIEIDLKNTAIPPPKRKALPKVSVLVEDEVALFCLKFLIGKLHAMRGRLTYANIKGKKKVSNVSGNYLQIFADNAHKIPELQRMVFIPDGDMKWGKSSKNKNVVLLPGDSAMEVQLFTMLKGIGAEDDFWSKCDGEGYSKQFAIGNYTTLLATDIDGVKKWFKAQRPFWGRGLSIVFDEYYNRNKSKCDDFLRRLKGAVDRCSVANA